MTWYNKYRPAKFGDVIGQSLVKEVLINSLKTGVIKHAYLFSGSKGIGKTTLARIFAGELNQITTNPEAKIDIIELDAASNTGIDNIRQLIESGQVPPINGKYKVYIIDEVHMLSKAAMNALLKILEEPPTYLIFLLATTNPEKVLPTVLSRLTKFNLASHSLEDILEVLKKACQNENLKIDQKALELIAKRSSGSLRDTYNLLETIASYNLPDYTEQKVAQLLGLLPEELMTNFSQKILQGDLDTQILSQIQQTGTDGNQFFIQLLEFLIDKHFLEQDQNPDLIVAIAEVLGLRLPIDSVLTYIGVLQNKLALKKNSSENLDLNVTKPKIKANPEPSQPKPYEAKKVSTPIVSELSQSYQKKPKIEDKEDILSASETQKINPQEPSQVSNSSLIEPQNTQTGNDNKDYTKPKIQSTATNFLQNLSKDAGFPLILQMILSDLNIEKFDDSEVSFSVTNKVFLAQMENIEVKSFLKTSVSSIYPSAKISFLEREKSKQVPVDEAWELPEEESFTQSYEAPVPQSEVFQSENTQPVAGEKIEPKNLEKTTPKKAKEPKKDEIFYTIYKQKPPELTADVKIRQEPIVVPEKKKPEEFDDLEDLFDLE